MFQFSRRIQRKSLPISSPLGKHPLAFARLHCIHTVWHAGMYIFTKHKWMLAMLLYPGIRFPSLWSEISTDSFAILLWIYVIFRGIRCIDFNFKTLPAPWTVYWMKLVNLNINRFPTSCKAIFFFQLNITYVWKNWKTIRTALYYVLFLSKHKLVYIFSMH